MNTEKWVGVGAASAAIAAIGGFLYVKRNERNKQTVNLFEIISNADEKVTKELFQQYVDEIKNSGKNLDDERVGEEQSTLLMLACRQGKPLFVPVLLQNGSSDKLRDSSDWQAIHLACLAGSDEIVEMLIAHDAANVTAKNQQNGWQPLHIAAAKNNLKQLKLFLSNGAPINEQNLQGHTVLIIAACNGSEEMLDFILESKGDVVDLNVKTEKHRETALYLACKNGHTSIARKLLEFKGASAVDVDSPSNTGATALHAAIYRGDLELVKLLVKHGARANASKADGSNCLHICAQSNRVQDIEIAEYLLSLGCELDAANRFGKTPLHDAAFFWKPQTCQVICGARCHCGYY